MLIVWAVDSIPHTHTEYTVLTLIIKFILFFVGVYCATWVNRIHFLSLIYYGKWPKLTLPPHLSLPFTTPFPTIPHNYTHYSPQLSPAIMCITVILAHIATLSPTLPHHFSIYYFICFFSILSLSAKTERVQFMMLEREK